MAITAAQVYIAIRSGGDLHDLANGPFESADLEALVARMVAAQATMRTCDLAIGDLAHQGPETAHPPTLHARVLHRVWQTVTDRVYDAQRGWIVKLNRWGEWVPWRDVCP